MVAQGVNSGGRDDNPYFTTTADTGCRLYGKSGQPGAGRTWRVPTQRELQLMWMFREAIGAIYRTNRWKKPARRKDTGLPLKRGRTMPGFRLYSGKPHCDTQDRRTATGMVRCVSDY
ncbi:hypothetical protein SFC43_15455 [Bacteroides sp. CR5/BHMF/2]|nr:hypothetical protein [Bacteroides sp. CR5/BHMF/2]